MTARFVAGTLALMMVIGVSSAAIITIGPGQPSPWTSVKSACDWLSANGIDENHVFEIEAGTYGQGECALTRSHDPFTITFRPKPGAVVTVTSTTQYVWHISGPDKVKVEGLRIQSQSTISAAAAVRVSSASGCRFSGCQMTMSASVGCHYGALFSGPTAVSDSLVNCRITINTTWAGAHAVYLYNATNPVVKGCVLTNAAAPTTTGIWAGVYFAIANGGSILNDSVGAGFSRGVYLYSIASGGGPITVTGCQIRNSASSEAIGISLAAGSGHTVADNYVQGWTATGNKGAGILLADARNCNVCYNTIVAGTGTGAFNCISLSGNASSNVFRNNILKLQNTNSYCYYQTHGTTQEPVYAGYNDLALAPGGTNVAYVTAVLTLAQWQARNAGDPTRNDNTGVLTSDPELDIDGFHLTSSSPCIGVGTTGTGIITDIDGDSRSTGFGNPDIGADEFAPMAFALTSPPDNPPAPQELELDLAWETSANAVSYDVYYGTPTLPPTPNASVLAPTTTLHVSGLSPSSDYVWRVAAKYSDHSRNCNADFNFTTKAGTPTIEVTAPNGGEVWTVATHENITWTSANSTTDKVYYSTDNGGSWLLLDEQTPPTHTYDWTIPNTPSAVCLVKVSAIGSSSTVEDQSDAVFTIQSPAPTVSVTAPSTGAVWEVGSSKNITWTHGGGEPTSNKVEFSSDGGSNWATLHDGATKTSHTWNPVAGPGSDPDAARVKVTATNLGGSDVKTVSFTLLGVPQLLSPGPGATGVPITGQLTWGATLGAADGYDVWLGTPAPVFVGSASNTYWDYTGLTHDAVYQWYIVAKNGAVTNQSETRSFTTIVAAAAAPALILPENNAENQPIDGYLHWYKADRATGYDVWLDVSNPPEFKVVDNQPDSFFHYTKSNNTRYYWKVVAHNIGGSTPSEVWNFKTIVEAPGAPELLLPENHAEDQPTAGVLSWQAGVGGNPDGYDVYLDDDDPPVHMVSANQVGTTYGYSGLPNGVKHYWKIVARNAGGEPESETWDFTTVVAASGAFNLLTPENGAPGVALAGDLTWEAATGATNYDVYLGISSPPPFVGNVVGATTYTYFGLSHNTLYYWAVEAKNANPIPTRCTEEFDFTTVTEAPQWPEGWVRVAPVPIVPTDKPVKDGGWLAFHEDRAGGTPVYYVAKGNKTTDFYRYYPVEDSWLERASIPHLEGTMTKPPSKGCVGVSDGSHYVYMTKGNNTLGFWRYNVDADTWELLTGVPEGPNRKKVKGGTDMVYAVYKDTGCVFLLKGYKTEFYRYNTEAKRWDTLSNAPGGGGRPKYDRGSFLVYDQAGHIYAHQAKYCDKTTGFHYMFRYDLGTGRWDTCKGMPLAGMHGGRVKNKKSKDGGCAAYQDGDIYALKGGNTQQFFKYVGGDTWVEFDTMPSNGTTGRKRYVKYGGDIVSFGYGAFFALKGNKTAEFWRYVKPTTACGSQPTAGSRSGIQAGRPTIRDLRFTISPNPMAAGFATVRLSGQAVKSVSGLARVFDAAGRCVLAWPFVIRSSSFGLPLDLRALSSGVYLVRLDAGGYSATRRLVVQR